MVGGPCIHAAQRAYLDGAPDSGPLLDTLVFQPRDDFRDRYAEPNGTVFIDTFSDAGSYALALSFRTPPPDSFNPDRDGRVTSNAPSVNTVRDNGGFIRNAVNWTAVAPSSRQPNALLPCGLTEDCGGGVTTSPAFSETLHGGRYGD